ncbi:hypothetical protein CDD81_3659 [Ophiocordyceps australis]|uniref:AMP-dependent synthetase/ligase domain-containing protein n=1 Tax=Ophiocordyceps australis TaxID=1399860 RepID=A0A2C5XX48_9HYPO|nr:hypothetical protein CDD81_3659 [Ophiocordyceps australis]
MSDMPLVLAAPAAAAGLAYVNARTSFWYDRQLLSCAAKSLLRVFIRQRRDRLSLFYVLEDHARHPATRNKDLLIFEGRHLTYSQIYDRVLRMGTWLRNKHGVKPGEIIAMDMTNSDSFIVVWWALWSIGARPAFINYNLTGKPLAHSLRSATTRLCVVDATIDIGDDVRGELAGSIEFVVLTAELEAEALGTPPQRAPDADRHQETLSDMAMLIYTTQALGRRFSTKLFWPEVRASGATSIQYVGETLRYLLAAAPQTDPVTGENLDRKHRVKLAFGNGLRPDIWNEFKERFGIETIAEFYGATEAPFALWNVSRNDLTAGAIGRNGWLYNKLQGLQVALVDVDWTTDLPRRDAHSGFCLRVRPGEPGEMLCRLPADDLERRFQGYYGNPGATSAKILRSVFSKDDAWFRTGDANVYGVELPHHDGRAGCVAICFAPDACSPSSSDPSDPSAPPIPLPETLRSLAAHVRANLPRYAQPQFLRVMPQMGDAAQTTGTNKQQKQHLRAAGVRPDSGVPGSLYWLQGDSYVPFAEDDWRALQAGRVKL